MTRSFSPRLDVLPTAQRDLWPALRPAPVPERELCRGPGNLTAAMGIDGAHNRRPLFKRPLTIEDRGLAPGPVAWGPRIGITKGVNHRWRCYVVNHPSVSARQG